MPIERATVRGSAADSTVIGTPAGATQDRSVLGRPPNRGPSVVSDGRASPPHGEGASIRLLRRDGRHACVGQAVGDGGQNSGEAPGGSTAVRFFGRHGGSDAILAGLRLLPPTVM